MEGIQEFTRLAALYIWKISNRRDSKYKVGNSRVIMRYCFDICVCVYTRVIVIFRRENSMVELMFGRASCLSGESGIGGQWYPGTREIFDRER